MKTIWRIAHKFPLYEVSIFGQVRRISTKRLLKPFYNIKLNNYATVFITKKAGSTYSSRSLARLVLNTFQFTTKRKQYALHHDMDHTNNANDNLKWSTLSDLHRYKRSGKPKGVYKWNIGKKKFRATLKIKNKIKTVGYFETYAEAQVAHYEAFLKAFGYEPYPMVRI